MTLESAWRINPLELAFDIDGVVADTMEVFVRLAHERYGLTHLTKEHISCYNLYTCLGVEKGILDDLICLTLDDPHTMEIPPMPGAPRGPHRACPQRASQNSLRPDLARVDNGMDLSDPSRRVSRQDYGHRFRGPRGQAGPSSRGSTCATSWKTASKHAAVKEAGIQPLLFVQPWNQNEPADGFIRVENWAGLKEWVLPPNVPLR